MNYAIKALINQGKLCKDLLQKKRSEFLEKDFEMTSDYEFCVADIHNLEKQIKEINEAIEILTS